MTESHAEKAESLLRFSQEIIRGVEGTSPVAAELIAEAQAHATLAVAEQQRIANLLALASFSHDSENGQRYFTKLNFSMELRSEAAKLLGLEDSP